MSDTCRIEERDSNGRLIYFKDSYGNEHWYDKRGNRIHYKHSDGYESWYDYDFNGKRIRSSYSDGHEQWYDEKGKTTEDPIKILLLSQKLYSEASR